MKQILPFLLLLPLISFGQVIEKMQPDTIYSNSMFLTPERLEVYSSPEHQQRCIEIETRLNLEKRTATAAERKILKNCQMCADSPWDLDLCCGWYCGGGEDTAYASSSLPNQGLYTYSAKNCHDLSYKTPWIEGAKGYGIGESITYVFRPENPRITEIIIVNGFVLSEDAWFENSRVKTLNVYINDKKFAILHLKDSKNDQVFRFDPIGTADRKDWEAMTQLPDWTMRFEIAEVYEGDLYDDTAISEIYFDGIDVH